MSEEIEDILDEKDRIIDGLETRLKECEDLLDSIVSRLKDYEEDSQNWDMFRKEVHGMLLNYVMSKN